MKEKITTTSPFLPPMEQYITHLMHIYDSQWITNIGKKHEKLQKALQEHLKCKYISLFTNGHLALETVIKALKLTGEIITTPFSFVSTSHAIVNAGCTPIFCDIDEETYTIDVSQIEQHITEKTSAILAVHVYGNCCDVEAIEKIANKYNLKVIYDAAHAFNVTYKGESIANFGDATMFSFHATKVFHTIEGGAIICKDSVLFEKIQAMINFGFSKPNTAQYIGTNAKMNEFQAAMGLCNLELLPSQIEWRGALFNHYKKRLDLNTYIDLPTFQSNTIPNYAYFPIRVKCGLRDELAEALEQKNIIARKYFYPLISNMPIYKDLYRPNHTPVAEKISEEVLVLPLHMNISQDDIDFICDVIIEWSEQLQLSI